jgi:intracellular sulfur oxidation DsrE/DsrF family protein
MSFSSSRIVRGTALLATASALALGVFGFNRFADPIATPQNPQFKDEWLKGLNGKHRQIFDTPDPGIGIPLIHVMNYYDTYNKAYGVKDADIDAVLTFYGSTTFHGLNDAMWAKYKLGEFMKINGPDGQPVTANPWRAAPVILGGPIPAASIEALQKRGMTGILCNNALGIFAGLVAKSQGLEQNVVYEDMKANILPGVELVPAMVIAIGQAQTKGLTYLRH